MRKPFTGSAVAASGLILVMVAGCARDEDQLTPVRGRVFFHQVPLTGGTIVFIPDADRGGNGPLARADIQPDGTFVLLTGTEAGAVPGWHRITVLAITPPGSPNLPRKYADPSQSGLAREIKAGADNSFELYLE